MRKYFLFSLIICALSVQTMWAQANRIRVNTILVEENPYIDVTHPTYGATGDGVTDDSDAWTAAIAAADGKIIEGGGKTYVLDSVVSISVSNFEIRNANFICDRPSEDSVNIENNYCFEIDGTVSQENGIFRDLGFSGSGYWGGIHSSILYNTTGWDPDDGYPTVNETAYATSRDGFKLYNCDFDSPYFEAIFVTNVQLDIDGLTANDVGNDNDQGAVYIRFTRDVHLNNIILDEFVNKGVSTAYVDGFTYSNFTLRTTGANTLPWYVGHFDRNGTISNIASIETNSQLAWKISYNATNVTVSNVVATTTSSAYIQGSTAITVSNCAVYTSGARALQLIYHNEYSQLIYNNKLMISDSYFISTEDGSSSPFVVDLSYSYDSTFQNNRVVGNIYSYPSWDFEVKNNSIYFSTAFGTPPQAVFIRQPDGFLLENNTIETAEDTYTIYVHGNSAEANLKIIGNNISNSATSYPAVSANYGTAGTIIYAGNQTFGTRTQAEVSIAASGWTVEDYTTMNELRVASDFQSLGTTSIVDNPPEFTMEDTGGTYDGFFTVDGGKLHIQNPGDTDGDMFTLDLANKRMGFGIATPGVNAHFGSETAGFVLELEAEDEYDPEIRFYEDGRGIMGKILYDESAIDMSFTNLVSGTTADMIFSTGTSGSMRLYGSGEFTTLNHYPVTDDTYYLGKNDDDTPFAWKGLILKDTTNGKYYRIEVISGSITATDLTD